MYNLKKLIAGKFFSEIYFAIPIQTLFLFELGLSFSQVAALESLLVLSATFFEIPTGIIGDWIGRKWSIVLSNLVKLVAWVPWFIAESWQHFAISFILFGLAQAFFSGADSAYIYEELKRKNKQQSMQKIFGIYNASYVIATGFGALVGGYLARNGTLESYYLLYKLIVIAQFVGTGFYLSLSENKKWSKKTLVPYTKTSLTSGFKHIFSSATLRGIFLLAVFTTPLSILLLRAHQPYLLRAGFPQEYFGISIFLSSSLVVFVKIYAHKLESWFGQKPALLIATILPGVFLSGTP